MDICCVGGTGCHCPLHFISFQITRPRGWYLLVAAIADALEATLAAAGDSEAITILRRLYQDEQSALQNNASCAGDFA